MITNYFTHTLLNLMLHILLSVPQNKDDLMPLLVLSSNFYHKLAFLRVDLGPIRLLNAYYPDL